MDFLACAVLLTAGIPLYVAWHANRENPLSHALIWAGAAWVLWCSAAWVSWATPTGEVLGYVAVCLTACAMIAVFGARRPGVTAWNFVVAGLLAVLLLPILQRWLAGGDFQLDALQILLLTTVLAAGVINYLPTRLGPSAVFIGAASGIQLVYLTAKLLNEEWKLGPLVLAALAPWWALWSWYRQKPAGTLFDQTWLSFRDRFGLIWGQRLREQFNRSAANAGWPAVLTWRGLRRRPGAPDLDPDVQLAMLQTLSSLMKRFGPRTAEVKDHPPN